MDIKSQATAYYNYELNGINQKAKSISNLLATPVKISSFFAKKIADTSFFKPNDIITYTIVLNNASNFKVTNVLIKDIIDNQTYIDNTFKYSYLKDENTEVKFFKNENSLDFSLEEMEENSICIITYKTKINENIDISVDIDNFSSISTNEATDIYINSLKLKQRFAEVVLEKSIFNDYAFLNSNLTYKIEAKNIGTVMAKNIEIIDKLPNTFVLSKTNPILINKKEYLNFSYDPNNFILKLSLEKINPQEIIEILINGYISK